MFREGCIAYLKQYEDVEDRILRSYYLNRGAFNHPVLVLQIQSDTTELLVCLVIVALIWYLTVGLTNFDHS